MALPIHVPGGNRILNSSAPPNQNEFQSASHARLLKRLESLQELSVLLISQHDVSSLLQQIVGRAVDLLGCDAGSLYLSSDSENLFFEVAVNRSVEIPFQKTKVDLRSKSLAGHVFKNRVLLNIPDAYQIPAREPYELNTDFDKRIGYRTRSILAAPLVTKEGVPLGVLQLINKKNNGDEAWPSAESEQLSLMPLFDTQDEQLLRSYAALASASLDNAQLYKSIAQLMDGFVTASVSVIEARDKSTRGHSERVALLSVELAKASEAYSQSNKSVRCFSGKQIHELKYAALLHDFGKIGVSEATLLKRDKLHDVQKEKIYARIQDFKAAAEIKMLRGYIEQCLIQGKIPEKSEYLTLEQAIGSGKQEFDALWNLISELTKPSVTVKEIETDQLKHLAHIHCESCAGEHLPLLRPEELQMLSIAKGSLSHEERLEIESHVQHTFEFLRRIPWTPDLSHVPHIAYAHHEKLDGTGYPLGLKHEQIPHQTRILTICDIFDALVARDRPYKPALPVEKALNILDQEMKQGKIDAHYLHLFIDAKIYAHPAFIELLENKKQLLHFQDVA